MGVISDVSGSGSGFGMKVLGLRIRGLGFGGWCESYFPRRVVGFGVPRIRRVREVWFSAPRF